MFSICIFLAFFNCEQKMEKIEVRTFEKEEPKQFLS